MSFERKELLAPEGIEQLKENLIARLAIPPEACDRLGRRRIVARAYDETVVVRHNTWPCHVPFTLPELWCTLRASLDGTIIQVRAKPRIIDHVAFGVVLFPVLLMLSLPLALFWIAGGCLDVGVYAWRVKCLYQDFRRVLPPNTTGWHRDDAPPKGE
jgi:hypothetical protein